MSRLSLSNYIVASVAFSIKKIMKKKEDGNIIIFNCDKVWNSDGANNIIEPKKKTKKWIY